MARRPKRSRQSAQASTPAAEDPGPQRAFLSDVLWLAGAAIIAFATSVPGGFVWLDHAEIEQANYRVVDGQDFRRVWHQAIEQYQARRSGVVVKQAGYWRPVYALAISLDWALWNGRPWLYHVENILWHVAVVLLLYVLGNQVFGANETGRRAVFWATLLFAVHPLGVHSVTWISGRKDTMCAAFGIASLVAFGRAVENARRTPAERTAAWLALSGLLLILAIGSKELGFVVPLVAAVWFCPPMVAKASARGSRETRTWLAGLGVLGAVALLLLTYRFVAVGARGLDAPYPTDSLLRNVAMSCNLWWHYARQILLPVEVRLSDAWPIVRHIGPSDWVSILALATAAGATVHGLFHRRPWALAIAWFAIWLLPTSGVMPLRHFRAERYLYPASWGLLLAAVFALLPLAERLFAAHARRVTQIALAIFVGWFALTTARENRRWWSDDGLFGHSVAQDPQHAEGQIELAALALERGDFAESAERSRAALRLLADPAIKAYGVPFFAHEVLGTALVRLGRPAEAAEQFQAMIGQSPESPGGYSGLAMSEAVSGNMAAARDHFLRALELDPQDGGTRTNLTLALLQLGDYGAAQPHIERLIEAEPEDAGHRARLAWCQWKLGQRDAARQSLERARALGGDDPVVGQVEQMIRTEQNATGGRP